MYRWSSGTDRQTRKAPLQVIRVKKSVARLLPEWSKKLGSLGKEVDRKLEQMRKSFAAGDNMQTTNYLTEGEAVLEEGRQRLREMFPVQTASFDEANNIIAEDTVVGTDWEDYTPSA